MEDTEEKRFALLKIIDSMAWCYNVHPLMKERIIDSLAYEGVQDLIFLWAKEKEREASYEIFWDITENINELYWFKCFEKTELSKKTDNKKAKETLTSSEAIETKPQESDVYLSFHHTSLLFPAFTEGSLRWHRFNNTGDFNRCVRRIGRKCVISIQDFRSWIEEQKEAT